jgi:hypothetical protein
MKHHKTIQRFYHLKRALHEWYRKEKLGINEEKITGLMQKTKRKTSN